MRDAFDHFEGKDSPKGDAFDHFSAKQESAPKSLLRTALQIPQGRAEFTPAGAGASLFQLLALGESELSPEEFHKLRQLAEQEGGQFDEESYEQARQEMLGMIPTVSNIARKVEEKTGIPLEPKEYHQKLLRLGSGSYKAQPGTLGQKAIAGVTAPSVKAGLDYAGVPEFVSDPVALGLGVGAGTASKQLPLSVAKKKPSGLTERRFEKRTTPVEISPRRKAKLDKKVESEFKDIAEDIISKSPIGETHSELKNNVEFKEATREGFKRVREAAEQISDTVPTKEVKKAVADRMKKKEETGFLASEYEEDYQRFAKGFIEKTKDKDINPAEIVLQFRKNNGSYKEINEPGKSYAYNQAKRDALRDYNLALEDVIKERYGDSEFGKIFEGVNEDWSKIMDAEVVDGFVNDLFDGKIKFKKGSDFFEKSGYQVPFKRALGEKGFGDFKTLLNDLMSTEQAHKLLNVAKEKGFVDLFKTGIRYLTFPNLAKLKFAYDVPKNIVKNLYQMTLDKPQLSIKWNKGVKAMKKGDFKTAETEFAALEKERARQEALGKFNEKLRDKD